MLHRVILIFGIFAFPVTVLAQGDPMEVQRCVWRCLANSSGASDPAYHACVDARCVAPAPSIQRSGAWEYGKLNPIDPPYLEGGFASLSSPDGRLRMWYLCGTDGSSLLSIEGSALTSVIGIAPVMAGSPPIDLLLAVGGARTLKVTAGWYEGALQAAVPKGGAPLFDLSQGRAVSIYTAADQRLIGTLGLAGSAVAIGSALSHCPG